ncbi:MAG: phosphoglucosamine mutase [Candidatus Sericytochromatia bacterium]|nr:phosphoglucosamine mutase [Candidatus Sericytochromatia bacterium]
MAGLFGTDGVRGLANRDLTPEMAFDLGRAGAAYLRAQSQEAHPTVVVGKDTRRSGDMLEAALASGICSVGVHVKRLGVVPTPGVAWLTRQLGAVAGVMISASHNPAPDNGIKFFGPNGFKLPDSVEEAIEDLMRDSGRLPRPIGEALGRIVDAPELTKQYEDYVVGLLPAGLHGVKVVVDCGHGAASQLAPTVLRRLGADVISLHIEPDGDNINRDSGSTHLHFLQEAVVAAQAQLGLAFDGDADRLLAVDHTGAAVDGDRVMLICLQHGVKSERLRTPSVVATVMSNMGFEDAVSALGGDFVRAKVGDRYVLEEMLKRDIRLGGEQSGHLIFLDDNTTGDGLITALRLLEAILASGRTLRELASEMVSYPQLLHNLRVRDLTGWADNKVIAAEVKQAEVELSGQGRILLRASGTEPLLRLMIEGRDPSQIERLAARLSKVIYQELSPAPTVLA